MITIIWGLNSPTSGHHLGPIVVSATASPGLVAGFQAEQSHESHGDTAQITNMSHRTSWIMNLVGSVSKILRDPLMFFVSGKNMGFALGCFIWQTGKPNHEASEKLGFFFSD